MKTIVKLALVLAFINALVHAASAYRTFYEFRDAAEQMLVFAGRQPSIQLHKEILEQAVELDIPLAPEDLNVRRTETRRIAQATYVQPVEFFPRYVYPLTFSFTVNAVSQPGLPADDSSAYLP